VAKRNQFDNIKSTYICQQVSQPVSAPRIRPTILALYKLLCVINCYCY